MRWLKITCKVSRAGVPVLLSATLLGSCARDETLGALGADAQNDVQTIILHLDTGVMLGQDGPVLPYPDGASSITECIGIDGGANDELVFASGHAARITLAWADQSTMASVGRIEVAPEIAGIVVGTPSVELIGKAPLDASDPTMSNMRADNGGFAFDVTWSSWTGNLCVNGVTAEWTFRTTLRLQCGGEERAVASDTTVWLCAHNSWASSGDACEECAVVCEMAPSPIVPGQIGDDLPLASALNVVIRPRVRVGRDVVLVADHDAKDGLAYGWRVSAGTVEHLDRDVVLWRLPAADSGQVQLAQVAVTGDDLAAVASLRWGPFAL